jgi:hypothetical protein
VRHLLRELVPATYAGVTGGGTRYSRRQIARIERWLGTLARELRRRNMVQFSFESSFHLLPMPLVVVCASLIAAFAGTAAMAAGVTALYGIAAAEDFLGPYFVALATIAGVNVVPWLPQIRKKTDGLPRWNILRLAGMSSASWATGVTLAVLAATVDSAANPTLLAVSGTLTTAGLTSLFFRTWARRRPEPSVAVNAVEFYRTYRRVIVRISALGGASYGLWVAAVAVVDGHGFAGLFTGFTTGMVCGFFIVLPTNGYGIFLLARAWLAIKGSLPFRLIGFLDEAHRRGLLRQTGGAYEFRHALLRDSLDAALGTGR